MLVPVCVSVVVVSPIRHGIGGEGSSLPVRERDKLCSIKGWVGQWVSQGNGWVDIWMDGWVN